MTEVVDLVTITLLLASAVLAVIRLVRPTAALPDRVLGADMIVIVIMSSVAAAAAMDDQRSFLPVAVILGLVGFLGTITVARYIEKRGARP